MSQVRVEKRDSIAGAVNRAWHMGGQKQSAVGMSRKCVDEAPIDSEDLPAYTTYRGGFRYERTGIKPKTLPS